MPNELNLRQVIELLRRAKGRRSLRKFSESVGVSYVTLHAVLRGERLPNDTILDYMGLEAVTLVRYIEK